MLQPNNVLKGNYRILQFLGGGTFGETYLAEDVQNVRKCAIKRLKSFPDNPDRLKLAKRLFDSEAKTLERLGKHDQIPELFDYFDENFEQNNEFYLVQQFVPGKTLNTEEITPGKQLSEPEVKKLLREILTVLAFVHQQKVIHRDLKPANLMRRDDGKIFIIDFGAVKEIGTQVTHLSESNIQKTIAIGTIGYLPPEQLEGKPNLASDVYAVGMMGIEALTGISPKDLDRDDRGQVIWRRFCAPVSDDFANILNKMVENNYRDRYHSAVQALQAFNSPLPTTEIQSPPRRNLMWVGGILGIIAVTIGVTVGVRFIGGFSPRVPVELSPYENAKVGIKFKYPRQSWDLQDTPNFITGEVVKLVSRHQVATVLITVESLDRPLSFADYTTRTIGEIEKIAIDPKQIERKDATLAKRPAVSVAYTVKDGGKIVKRMEVWALKSNQAYIMTYEGESGNDEELLLNFQMMVDSFEMD
ncbi:hypothetical protein BCD67_16945 [Oscillatoriales cyanobacterium USR001]|nr:hypothetical protein BCD67_16945 [Oscillatoriales cyanobacterium USR001]